MKYVKVFTDLHKALEPFSYTEKGRLFDALLRYAESGEQPELTGNERYIWPTIKADIDRQTEAYQHQCEVNKANITNRYKPLRAVTNGNEPKQEKTKEKTKDKDNKTLSPGFDEFWEAYPRKIGKAEARKSWNKLQPNDELKQWILDAVQKQKMWEQWQREDGRFIPHPATWLNQQRWEDEGIAARREHEEWLQALSKVPIN